MSTALSILSDDDDGVESHTNETKQNKNKNKYKNNKTQLTM